MVKNCQLSIVIPTFNRAEALDHSLKVHIPLLRDHGIGFHARLTLKAGIRDGPVSDALELLF